MPIGTSTQEITPKPGFIARSAMYAEYEAQKALGIKTDRICENLNLSRATFFRAIAEHEKGEKPDRLLPLKPSSTEASDVSKRDYSRPDESSVHEEASPVAAETVAEANGTKTN